LEIEDGISKLLVQVNNLSTYIITKIILSQMDLRKIPSPLYIK
jgi:hypothetical protein